MTIPAVPNINIDLRGLQNPEPILRLAEAAPGWRAGDTVRVVADDDRFAGDFLRWCVGSNLDLLSLRYPSTGETELTLRVQRGIQKLSV